MVLNAERILLRKQENKKQNQMLIVFLAGIETSGSYGLKQVFKGDEKGVKACQKEVQQ